MATAELRRLASRRDRRGRGDLVVGTVDEACPVVRLGPPVRPPPSPPTVGDPLDPLDPLDPVVRAAPVVLVVVAVVPQLVRHGRPPHPALP